MIRLPWQRPAVAQVCPDCKSEHGFNGTGPDGRYVRVTMVASGQVTAVGYPRTCCACRCEYVALDDGRTFRLYFARGGQKAAEPPPEDGKPKEKPELERRPRGFEDMRIPGSRA